MRILKEDSKLLLRRVLTEDILDRHIWVVDGLIVIVFAAFVAAGIDHVISSRIDVFVQGFKQKGAARKNPGKKKKVKRDIIKAAEFRPVDGMTILKRNFFDSVTGPLDDSGRDLADLLDSGTIENPGEAQEEYPPPKCELHEKGVSVVGLFASKDPGWSFASVKEGKETQILSIGDTIKSYEVDAITWRFLFLEEQGSASICYLDIWEEEEKGGGRSPKGPHGKKSASRKSPHSKKSGEKESLASMMKKYIEDVSKNEKNVDRRLVDYIVDNQHELMKSGGKIVPRINHGKIEGFKVYQIRKTSLWGKLGIQNGDLIRSINGMSMTGPAAAMDAFKNLKSSDHLSVNLERRGKNVNLDLNIR